MPKVRVRVRFRVGQEIVATLENERENPVGMPAHLAYEPLRREAADRDRF